jgi:FAD/FMN-containing dehydrogenase
VPAHPSLAERPPEFRGVFRTDLEARARYAEGAGIARCVPGAVAVPADPIDVATLVRWARATGTPLIPRGSGSGMAAGAVGPHLLVDLSRLRTLGSVDPDSRRVVAGAGIRLGEVNVAARAHGLRVPVDPSSAAFCTVGGMAATNAAGARTLRYGATRPWVQGIHAVFDDGQAAWIRRGAHAPIEVPAVARLMAACATLRAIPADARGMLRHPGVRKESSGYGLADALAPGGDLVDLLVGSEGTLALFTAIEWRLDVIPTASATLLATFASLEDAAACAVAAGAAGAAACELLDRTFLDIAQSGGPTGIPEDAEAVLLIALEGAQVDEVRPRLDAVRHEARRYRATLLREAVDVEQERTLWALRHAASPILAALAPRLRSMQFIEDGCVPPDRFPAYVRGVRRALGRAGCPGVIFGHAGDAHAHVNPLVDTTVPGWRDRVRGLLEEVVALTVDLGGTLAGEHGDGRLRAPFWSQTWAPDARSAFETIKAAADPSNLLNPGCKVASPEAPPFTTLRHDPAAAPLPPSARATLDEIERQRDWGRFRLAGLPEAD